MIAEPYIHTTGVFAGEITWTDPINKKEGWKPYADFEREKLKALDGILFYPEREFEGAYAVSYRKDKGSYYSAGLTGYGLSDYRADSESSRLLKRAEFLKAVCEQEGVEWLAKKERAEFGSYELPEYKCNHPSNKTCKECRPNDEEREFRKALLDVLQTRLSNLYGCDGKDRGQLWGDIKDLRKRFL